MRVLSDKDADLAIIRGKTVAIVGYGNQGHAHAANLMEQGVRVIVGLREDSASRPRALDAGHDVRPVAAAVREADVIMNLAPDEAQAEIYEEAIAPNLKKGAALAFGHGFSVRF